MSDSFVQLSPDSSGKKMDTRTEGTNAEHRQVMVLGDPATNAGVAPVDGTKGLAVDLTATGANTTALKTDSSATTQPVSAASLPLPTGAATAAKQPALGTAGTASADVITVQGKASMTPVLIDGSATTQPVSGTVTVNGTVTTTPPSNASTNIAQVAGATVATGHGTAAGALRVELPTDGTGVVNSAQSGTWTVQPGNTANTTAWKVDGSAVTQPVSLATNTPTLQSGSTTAVTQATAANLNATVTPASATGSAIPAVAQPAGWQARTTDIANATSGNLLMGIADKAGKAVSLPYAIPELFTTPSVGSATGTSAVSVISAQGAGIKIYITSISTVNTGAAGSLVTIQSDPTGTPTTLWQMVNPSGGGSNITFPVPLVVPANKAVGFTAGTASTTQYVSLMGYTGA